MLTSEQIIKNAQYEQVISLLNLKDKNGHVTKAELSAVHSDIEAHTLTVYAEVEKLEEMREALLELATSVLTNSQDAQHLASTLHTKYN